MKTIIICLISVSLYAQSNMLLLMGDSFKPENLNPNLYLTNASGITKDANNKVTAWTDGTYSFTQADTSKSPTYLEGSGLSFDGTADQLQLADAGGNPFDFGTSNVSVEAWIYLTASGARVIFSKYAGTSPRWYIYANSNLLFYFRNAVGDVQINDATTAPAINLVTPNAWHHVVAVFDRDLGADLYIDGVLTETDHSAGWTNTAAVDVNNAAPTAIGAANNGSYFVGNMSVIRYYLKALTPSDIAKLYAYGRK